jgi:hypothetical protein
MPDIPLALGELLLALLIFVVLALVAGLVIFTLSAGYLIVGPACILVALLPNRWTSAMTEGYFT